MNLSLSAPADPAHHETRGELHASLNPIFTVTAAQDELEMARAEIARLEGLNQRLLRLLVHGLGSPLTVVLAYLRLWQDRWDAIALEDLELVTEQALLLKSRLDDLALLDQSEAGRLRIAREPVQLYPLLRRVLQQSSGELDAKQLSVQLDMKYHKSVPVDAELMVRVLDHLVSNAMKFSPEGGKITIAVRREHEWCLVTVQDQGAGLDEQQASQIFDPFFQCDGSLSRRYEGLGIGLKMVRTIVEAHGGDVRVLSQVGHGSTFIVRVPLS